MAFAIVHKESLCDSFVHNDESDGRLLGTLVVHLVDDILELSYLFLDNLSSHGISNSISVDDEVIREQLLWVSTFKSLNGLLQSIC